MTTKRGINTVPKNTFRVPEAKVRKMKTMVERTLDGDRVEAVKLAEVISTSDAPLALAQVINATILPQYDARPGIWSKFATKRVATSFRNISFYELVGDFQKLQHAGNEANLPAGVLPVVPELSPYPEVSILATETAIQQNKRGARFAYSWEAHKEDPIGFLSDFPNQLVNLAVDTEDWTATVGGLEQVTAYSQFGGGVAPDGTAVPANAALGLDAVALAMSQVRSREVGGRRVQVPSFTLVIPPALELRALYLKNLIGLSVTDGNNTYDVGNFNPLGNLEIVVNPFLSSDSAWYLVPTPGTASRIAVAQVFLAGEEAPDLRVENLAGGYFPGGGDVSWENGSFDNDSMQFRLRTVGGSGLVSEEGIIWSDGTNA